MHFVSRRAWLGLSAAALAALTGCSLFTPAAPKGGSPEAWAAISNGAPVRVAVFTGPGARGVGMFRWVQLMDCAPELEATYVDGAAIRAGALERADLLVMPGGMSNVEEKDLGKEGQLAVRKFIEDGGSYLGTCAGAFLVMADKTRDKPLGIVPYKHRKGGWGGEAVLKVQYTKEAEDLYGIKASARHERFNGGPVMDSAGAVPGSDFKVMSRFACNLHSYATTNRFGSTGGVLPKMADGASAVAGTFGKGRVWVFSTHPEYYPDTWDSVKDALTFATGRDVTLCAPQRTRHQLSVGWYCKPGPGPAAADLARELIRDADFDVTPYSTDEILHTDLRHEDALVVPDAADTNVVQKMLAPKGSQMKSLVAFMDRGGTIVTWGAAAANFAPHDNLVVVGKGADVPRALRTLKNAPPPAPRAAPAAKVANPIRVAAYYDAGASGTASVRWAKMLSLSPDCEFTAVDAVDVRNGALDRADLYIAPGGNAAVQGKALQLKGRKNLVSFVRNGGWFFGTCAGCYLALAPAEDEKTNTTSRLSLLPYTRQKSPYRGGAMLDIRLTDNADLFGLQPKSLRTVRYHGGPVLTASEMLPEADVKEIATFACEGVYDSFPNSQPTMLGHPALVAGTFGKGRVVGCSPHPESFTDTQDIIRGGLRFLTGRACEAEYPQRTRGNLAVGFHSAHVGKAGMMLATELFREPTLDVRVVGTDNVGQGALEHCDALVYSHPGKATNYRRFRAFTEKGGRLFVFGTEAELATLPNDLTNVKTFTRTADLKQALVEYSKEK